MKANSLTIGLISRLLSFVSPQVFLGKYLERKYIIPMLNQAHTDYTYRTSVGQYWYRIYQNLEVSIQMSTRYSEDENGHLKFEKYSLF
jgi:hypothetical protein